MSFENSGMGWVPDYPDFRDFNFDTLIENDSKRPSVTNLAILKKVTEDTVSDAPTMTLPESVDLRYWCSPIENQESIGSCTAHAGIALLEYFERKASGNHIDASRLFVYKTTRNLLKWTGDRGAFTRKTMAALTLFGAPPEEYWPYDVSKFDEEPPAFCYAFAQNYKALEYYKLDSPGQDPDELLNLIKTNLASGIPSMFGFSVYQSIRSKETELTGKIPFPDIRDSRIGGHAVAAVGYNDNMVIKNPKTGNPEYKGAILIRNSWGSGWGDSGYGWLPYEYILRGLAVDWWIIMNFNWIDTNKFGEGMISKLSVVLPTEDSLTAEAETDRKIKINVPGIGNVTGTLIDCPHCHIKKKCVTAYIKKSILIGVITVKLEYCPCCGYLKLYSPFSLNTANMLSTQTFSDENELTQYALAAGISDIQEIIIPGIEFLKDIIKAQGGKLGPFSFNHQGIQFAGELDLCSKCKEIRVNISATIAGFGAKIHYCPWCNSFSIEFLSIFSGNALPQS